jgi:hypothetical protein
LRNPIAISILTGCLALGMGGCADTGASAGCIAGNAAVVTLELSLWIASNGRMVPEGTIPCGHGSASQANSVETVKALREQADKGDPNAQFILGSAYAGRTGIVVRQDLVQADMWLTISANAGNRPAAEQSADLEKSMTASQIAEAKKLASAWRPTGTGVASAANAGTTASPQPANLPPAAPPVPAGVDVPITLDLAGSSSVGTGKLDQGHISAALVAFGKPVTITGDIKGDWLTVEIVGALDPHASLWEGMCMATGKAYRPAGQIAVAMVGSCGPASPRVVLHLQLPERS